MSKKNNINKRYKGNGTGNYYSFGSGLKSAFKVDSSALGAGVANAGLGMASNLVGGIAGSALSGGMSSGAGNAISGLSSIASAIPGPWGAIAGAGLQVVGGLVNRAFGSKMNDQKIAEVNAANSQLANYAPAASSMDEFSNQAANAPAVVGFTQSDIGKDGWFSRKAKRKYNELLAKQQRAEIKANQAVENNLDNLIESQTGDLLRNVAAFGGPINMQYTGVMSPFGNRFAEGGGIHIKPSKKGTFTAAASKHGKSVQAFASQVLANKDNYSPAMVKKANFAKNASKWHAFGGQLLSHGAEWDNNFTHIGNGDTHENNPNEGVQMGVDNEGIPNLVEEGEVVYNDYVFSNRLKADGGLLDTVNLPNRYKKKTFADVAKKLAKESEERPNDPISKRGFDDSMMKLQMAQEYVRAKKQAGQEGKKYSHGGKMGRIYDQVDDGNPFLVKPSGDPFFDWLNTSEATEPTPPALTPMQQIAKDKGVQIKKDDPLSFTPPKVEVMGGISSSDTDIDTSGDASLAPTWMRYAPVLGSALGVIQNAFSKPDYSGAERLESYVANNPPQQVTAPTVSQKLRYDPIDPNRLANQRRASNAATRRAIMTASRRSPAAAMDSLLRQGYIENLALGEDTVKGILANQQQEQAIAGFNRATDMANAESNLKAQIANQEARQKATALGAELTSKGVAMREAIDANREASANANMSNLFDSLGDIGRENYAMNQFDMLVDAGYFGTLSSKPQGWSNKRWDNYKKNAAQRTQEARALLDKTEAERKAEAASRAKQEQARADEMKALREEITALKRELLTKK